jgi:hypothetical protein
MHATRVALLAGLLMIFRERYTEDRARWPFELQIGAAFHDVGRQDEGPDEWELESEKIFARWLSRTPGVRVEARCVLQFKGNDLDGCAEKDIVKDADTLDLQRVISVRTLFDVTRLTFWRDRRIPTQKKQDIVNETWAFIHLTEKPELKRQLEDSGAVYFHLMHLLVHEHRTTSSYPLLYDLLERLAGNES